MFFKVAFRNIWRNKSRSLITIASIFFAVLFATFMNAFQKGVWDRMLDNVVTFYYGYVQIHEAGYWADQSIDNSFELSSELLELPNNIDKLQGLVPRLESFALASYKQQTSGMMIVGTDPISENELTLLEDKLIEGDYLKKSDQAVLLAEGVKDKLKISLGDTIVLISQGYHGVNAAGKYPVKGIIKFASPDLNKRMVYLPIQEAQYFFGADNLATSLALDIESRSDIQDVVDQLKEKLGEEEYEIMDWSEMIPELVEAQKSDAAGNYIFLLVLYVLITFGIFGTVLMMVKEREYEFGILISVGMKRRILAFITWMEIVFLGLIGAAAGILACIPLTYYFHVNPLDLTGSDSDIMAAYDKWGFDPVLPTAFEFDIFFYQALIVFILISILATYAIYKIKVLKPIEAMRA